MSTSQRSAMRRTLRVTQAPGGDLRGPQSPRVFDDDGNLPTHSPALETVDYIDSVLLSSRSTTTSSTRLQTPSHTARASAFSEVPLSYSPQMLPRNGVHPNCAPTAASSTTSAEAGVQRITTIAASGDGTVGGSKKQDGTTVAGYTPEKTVPRSLVDGSNGTDSSQVPTSGGNKNDNSGSHLRPVEESLSFEFYNSAQPGGYHTTHNPMKLNSNISPTDARIPRGFVGNRYRESPVAPNMLPMVPLPDSFSQRYVMSTSLRDQQVDGGRYAGMSQSSRFEDAHQLVPQPLDGEESLIEGSNHNRTQLLDDVVRHSTTESFSMDDGAGGGGSAQPPRVDASMNSQNFIRSYKRRHATKGRGSAAAGANNNVGGANDRYTSTSMSSSPQVSADIAAPNGNNDNRSGTGAGLAGPEVFSSDQLTRMPTATHRKQRGGHIKGGGVTTTERETGGEESRDTVGERHRANVLGVHSSDTLLHPGNAACADGSFSPPSSDFSIVRAPVTGLRAKVLGNNAVDEDEVAEDPEARELLAKQLENFVSKVVKQHHGEGNGAPPQQSQSGSSAVAQESETRAEILRRANAEATKEDNATGDAAKQPSTSTSLSSAPPGAAHAGDHHHHGSSNEPSSGVGGGKPKKGKKANKHVRFNLEGLTPRDEGPNALRMPRHSATRDDGEPSTRSPSPPLIKPHAGSNNDNDNGNNNHTLAGRNSRANTDGNTNASAPRHGSPNTVDARSLLRAGVTEPDLLSPSSPVVEGLFDSVAEIMVLEKGTSRQTAESPPLARYSGAASPSASSFVHTQRQMSMRTEGDQLQRAPITPDTAFIPLSAPPTMLMTLPTKSVPVPPAPTTITQIMSSAQEPQKKRRSAGKVRRATKMHRKAAVALVAGAGESVTIARSSDSSSVQQSQLAPLEQMQEGSVLSSAEMCRSEDGQRQPPVSTSNFHSHPSPSAKPSLSSASTSAVSDGETTSPRHRTTAVERKAKNNNSAPTAPTSTTTTTTRATAPAPLAAMAVGSVAPPLRATQVVPPRQPSAVPVVAAPATPKGGGAAHSRAAARKGSAGTTPATVPAATTVAGAAPSSRRSSVSVTCANGSKSGTFAELPPLSATSRSHASTPDVSGPPSSAVAAMTAPTVATADTTSALASEVHVLLSPALARRAAASHDTIISNSSVGDFASVGGPRASSTQQQQQPGPRMERSCSAAECKRDRDVSPLSASSSKRSITREPSLNTTGTTNVSAAQLNTQVLPRLSSSSLKTHSTSQTMTQPSA